MDDILIITPQSNNEGNKTPIVNRFKWSDIYDSEVTKIKQMDEKLRDKERLSPGKKMASRSNSPVKGGANSQQELIRKL